MIVYIVKKEYRIEGVYDSREKAVDAANTINDYEYNYRGADPHGPQFRVEEYKVE